MNTNIIPFTDEQISTMCASYEAGASIDSLCGEYGVSPSVIQYRLRANGIEIRRRGAPKLKRNELLLSQISDMRKSGMTIAQVCGRLGISPQTYYARINA